MGARGNAGILSALVNMAATPDETMNHRSFTEVYTEGLRYFMGQGSLNHTPAQLSRDLKEHGIDYMVIGAVALLAHGYPRFTEDIVLVLTRRRIRSLSSRADRIRVCSGISRCKKGTKINQGRNHD